MKEEEQDRICVERCLKGDLQAFGTLMDRYQRPVFNVILRMVGNAEDAREICQQVFMKSYEHLATYDSGRKFFSWIYRMAVNESINHLKARRRFEELSDKVPFSEADPAERFEAVETGENLNEAIMELPPDYRAVVILRHFLQLTYGEVAEVLHLTEPLIKSRLFTARQILRKALESRGYVGT